MPPRSARATACGAIFEYLPRERPRAHVAAVEKCEEAAERTATVSTFATANVMLTLMDADWSVELGADDEALEFPWSSPDGALCYCDLKRHPEKLVQLDEAARYPELREFLKTVNGPASRFVSAKSDVWSDGEISQAEEIYEAAARFGSYVDVLFDIEADGELPFSFEEHERIVVRLAELLEKAPDMKAAAEFIVRRCYYHSVDDPVRPGFYITAYLFGYGQDEDQARRQWAIALSLVGNAILQLSAELRAN